MGTAKMTKKMFVAAALAVVGSSAFAGGGYVEASLGMSHVNQTCPAGSECENNQPAGRLIGGYYHLNPLVSIEVGVFNFGKAKGALSSTQQPGLIQARLQSMARYVGLSLRLPVDDDFSVTARLGAANVMSQLRTDTGIKEESTRTNLLWGVGAEYRIEGNLLATVSMEATKTGNVAGSGRGALTMVSAGLRYNF